jgi:hypothetical protein
MWYSCSSVNKTNKCDISEIFVKSGVWLRQLFYFKNSSTVNSGGNNFMQEVIILSLVYLYQNLLSECLLVYILISSIKKLQNILIISIDNQYFFLFVTNTCSVIHGFSSLNYSPLYVCFPDNHIDFFSCPVPNHFL